MKIGTLLLILVISFVVFFKVPSNDFVNDDRGQTVDNPLVYSVSNIPRIFLGGTQFAPEAKQALGHYYRPMMTTVFTLVISTFGPKASFLHLIQIIVFAINAYLVYMVLRKFLPEALSTILAIIFLVHPINTEVAVYISAMQDVLFFFFGMLALVIVLYTRSSRGILLANFLVFLSLLSKETGILFFVPLFLLTYFSNQEEREWQTQLTLSTLFSVFIIGAYFIIRMSIYLTGSPVVQEIPILTAPFADVLKTIPSILFFYIKTLIFPRDLAFSHMWVVHDLTLFNFYLPLLADIVFISVILFVGFLCRKNKIVFISFLFFVIWFIVGMFFHMQVLFRLDGTAAERWFYFPFVGLLGVIGIAAMYLPLYKMKFMIALSTISVVLIASLSIRTSMRTMDWKDALTLYSKDVMSEKDPIIEAAYGGVLLNAGKIQEAEYHLQRSVVLNPNGVRNWTVLGVLYEEKDERDEAKKAYAIAMENGKNSNIKNSIAYQGYSRLLLANDEYEQAVDFTKKALNIFHGDTILMEQLRTAEQAVSNSAKKEEVK